jgi:hypothetical protein
MSLKDEIEKLVAAERKKLEDKDQADADFNTRKRLRFEPLRALLTDLSNSIESIYLKVNLFTDSASVELGQLTDGIKGKDTRWRIYPNWSFPGTEKESPTFTIEETEYYWFPEYHDKERRLDFSLESEVLEYLVKKITEKVAFYRHLHSKYK